MLRMADALKKSGFSKAACSARRIAMRSTYVFFWKYPSWDFQDVDCIARSAIEQTPLVLAYQLSFLGCVASSGMALEEAAVSSTTVLGSSMSSASGSAGAMTGSASGSAMSKCCGCASQNNLQNARTANPSIKENITKLGEGPPALSPSSR
jgi:hypothetical protein